MVLGGIKLLIAEWLVILIAQIVSVVFFVKTFSFPKSAADPGGLALFPRVFCIITLIAAISITVQMLKRSSSSTALLESIKRLFISFKKGANDESSISNRLTSYIFVFTILYPLLIVRAGFLMSTIAYTFVLMKLFRTNSLVSLLFSSILGIGLYLLFAQILNVFVLPGIWVEKILE